MRLRMVTTLGLALAVAASSSPGLAEDTPPAPRAAKPEADSARAAGIAWFGTWDAGRAEAKRTGRPILLVAAAPQCHGAPGVW